MRSSLIALALVLGGVGATVTLSSPAAGETTASCSKTERGTVAVGKVVAREGEVYQGTTRVFPGTVLFKDSILCTKGHANVTFSVDKLLKSDCQMLETSSLKLYPSGESPKGEVVLKFEQGRTYCGTEKKTKKVFYKVGRTIVRTKDPLFAVVVAGRKSLIKVAKGVVTVKGSRGRAVTVGAGQQTTVAATGTAQRPVPLVQTAEDKKSFAAVKANLPKPDFGRPDADGSAALKRIYSRGEIRVGFGSVFSADAGSQLFAQDFFDFLAKSWRLGFYYGADETPPLVESLRAQELDVVVATDADGQKGLDTLPLFEDTNGKVWSLAVEHDPAFLEALRRFMRSAVNEGQYSAFYRAAFDREPSLKVIEPVLSG